MNKANILKVADDVERSDSFNMSGYENECGSPGCIAGHAYYRAKQEDLDKGDLTPSSFTHRYGGHCYEDVATHYLGISIGRLALFMPAEDVPGCGKRYSYCAYLGKRGHITKEHAVRCLRHLATTGEVDWVASA